MQKISEPPYLPLWARLLLSLGYGVVAFIIACVMSWPLRITGDVGTFLLLTSVTIAVILPHLRYPHRYLAIGVPFFIILFWFLVSLYIFPSLVKPYDLAKAGWTLSANAVLVPSKTTFMNSNLTSGAGVSYYYESKNPIADYKKMHDFYKDYLTMHGWKVTVDENGEQSHIGFEKQSVSTIVNIYFEKDPFYPIQLGIGFP